MADSRPMPLEAYVAVMRTYAAIMERRRAAQEAMRVGARTYTPEQAEFITRAVQDRVSLPEPPSEIES